MGESNRRVAALRTLCRALGGDPDQLARPTPHGWAHVLGLASAHGLLPALWVALRDAGVVVALPADAAAAIEGLAADRNPPELMLQRAYERNRERQEALVRAGVRTLDRLAVSGIAALPLKGLHVLLVGLWPDPGARAMVDVDILVPLARSQDAWDAALAVGFEPAPESAGEFADHQLAPLRDVDHAYLEIHTRLFRGRWDALLTPEEVLASAAPRHGSHGLHLAMSDTHALVTLIAHAQLQDDTYRRLEIPLRALHETRQWMRRGDAAIDWDEVVGRFDRAREGAVLRAHLLTLRALFGTALPLPIGRAVRARIHTRTLVPLVRLRRVQRAANYVRYLPRSFGRVRLIAQYGPPTGVLWIWRARARHVGARLRDRATNGLLAPAGRALEPVRRRARRARARARRRWRRTFVELNQDWRRTILVVGGGRSGTTWLAEVLNHRRDHRFIFEPFRAGAVAAARPFTEGEYLEPTHADPVRLAAATDLLSGRVRSRRTDSLNRRHIVRRRIVKCIRITNLVPWIHRQFPGLRVVYLVRHPGAVAVSRIAAGFRDGVDHLRAVPGLCDGPLAPFVGVIDAFARTDNRFERHVLAWCMQNRVVLTGSVPGLHVVCWEHLVTEPDRELARLEKTCGIVLGAQARRWMARRSSIGGDDRTLAAARVGRIDAWVERVDARDRLRAAEIVTAMGLDHVYGLEPEPRCTGADLGGARVTPNDGA